MADKKARRSSAPAKTPTPTPIRHDAVSLVDELATLLHRHELSEVEVEKDGLYVRLVGAGGVVQTTVAPAAGKAASATAPQKLETATETTDGNISYITSPFVGTFYRAPNPEAAPFVDEGTKIKKGQVLCIVEAMKLMNEIESEVEGVITQILVESGQPVEYGEPLFKIRQG
ncbi:MAG: acetyl-CoA carboxylase biotin carboxyl carrier protein [Polyangia bacterium]